MMWLLLFGLTAMVVMLPLIPALVEWRWPTDVVPLFIDKDDAVDPTFLARSFASHLATAQALGQTHLGRCRIATILPRPPWPLDARERAAARSRRVWDVIGDAELPDGVAFLGEVASRGSMHAATGGIYRALWAGADMHLPARCTVLRWAHGARIDVGKGCALAGRVSADEVITVANGTTFVLLHAPAVRFAPVWSGRARMPMPLPAIPPGMLGSGLPESVRWDPASARGSCEASLDIGDGCGWGGDLVCGGNLRVGAGCKVQGSLKARGALTLGAGCAVTGSLVAEGTIKLGPGCTVRGSVISESRIVLCKGCVIGASDHPCTVAAPRIDVGSGVVVHGTVWAGERGRCLGTDVVLPEAAEAVARPRSATTALEAAV